jgi:hypothetical protein
MGRRTGEGQRGSRRWSKGKGEWDEGRKRMSGIEERGREWVMMKGEWWRCECA